jgi:uncharacterized protein YpiB (UPF0302 family)
MSEHQLKLLGKQFEYLHHVANVPMAFKTRYYKVTTSENIMHPILTNLTMTLFQILSFQQNVHCSSSASNRQNSTNPQILNVTTHSQIKYKLMYNYIKTLNNTKNARDGQTFQGRSQA